MSVLLTGAAGFIGMHTALRLLQRGEEVVGVDNLTPYYDPALKQARLERLVAWPKFHFHKSDVSDRAAMKAVVADHDGIDRIVHLAAQAGVRHSLENPHSYTSANVEGQLVLLEMARDLGPRCRHMVYASSSSVYGGNTKLPFSESDSVDLPLSLYAATKRSGELMAHCYSHLFKIRTTGLRFFTVYGPWGRPDMAAYLFASAIHEGRPITVFNNGDMRRDFTYIDDIVTGIVAVLDSPQIADGPTPARIYNIGNHRSEALGEYVALVERCMGREAEKIFLPMQPGDVKETYADISALQRDVGFEPTTQISEGIPRFIDWFKQYHNL
jgi:UDP-glucuronate 4-epimerase